ncbi:MAG: AbrB/MazE/SpoVT family DNA-binding domain-containing protein [Alphaproteobacteria bacterium]|jgi:putative addiction module antidote|nr:AbrB/MazE/SpoVT family DNA-binding domain-containing protein [Alphaproteobacteria bacterium]
MFGKTKIIQIGNSVGIVLPKEALAALHAEKGDTVTLSASPDGVKLSSFDEEKTRQLELVRAIMKKRRHALRELAK